MGLDTKLARLYMHLSPVVSEIIEIPLVIVFFELTATSEWNIWAIVQNGQALNVVSICASGIFL